MTKTEALREIEVLRRNAERNMNTAPRQYQRIAQQMRADAFEEAIKIVKKIEVNK